MAENNKKTTSERALKCQVCGERARYLVGIDGYCVEHAPPGVHERPPTTMFGAPKPGEVIRCEACGAVARYLVHGAGEQPTPLCAEHAPPGMHTVLEAGARMREAGPAPGSYLPPLPPVYGQILLTILRAIEAQGAEKKNNLRVVLAAERLAEAARWASLRSSQGAVGDGTLLGEALDAYEDAKTAHGVGDVPVVVGEKVEP